MRTTTQLIGLLLAVSTLTAYAQAPTSPTSKTLTPAEQKRQERLQREIEAQRKFKAEMAERQRQYFAEQAEKERKRKEREAQKEAQKRGETPTAKTEAPKSVPSSTAPASAPAPATSPVTAPPAATSPISTAPADAPTPTPSKASTADREREARRASEAARQEQAAREKAARQAQDAQNREAAQKQRDALQQQREAARRQAELERQQQQQQRDAERALERQTKEQRRREEAATAVATRPDTTAAFSARKQLFPKDHLFAPILLDPLQSQTYGSVLPLFVSNGERYEGTIVPFAFGLQKPFFRRQTGTNRASEWALDVASFTQFEVYKDEKINKQRRQLINTDYRVGISYHLRRGPGTWRFRAYHLSSHLGDDFIIRNQLNFRLPNAVNYELIDATYSQQIRDVRVYGGLGVGLRISQERKPLSAQAGFWYKKPSTKNSQLVGGLDLKMWQQTNFRPGVKAGIGTTVGQGPNNLTFLLETYAGFRPYSIYEADRVFWLGVGVYLQPF
ncbi:DUF1207 domain-containing protein [Rudanella lutea]|uniref:DUF1207 domain-containing protein n=1 Tax=Rudanella lutea TaxID=451374 RepID=UPI00039EDAF6|nr:DUF1207 domain-containing protein [Rudanella lutea]